MSETVLFQTIHFTISTQFSSIWPIDRTQPGATTSGQSGPGSDGNEGAFCLALIICLHTLKQLRELQSNTNSFIYTQLNDFILLLYNINNSI